MPITRVLVVEDDLTWGELLTSVLRKRGYEAAWFVAAELEGVHGVKLMDPDGKTAILNADEYDIALVDGRLKRSAIDGWDLTPRLVEAGLPVIALSGADFFNDQMIKAGARAKMAKDELFGGILRGQITLER